MAKDDLEVRKFYVNEDGLIAISCNKCYFEKTVHTEDIRELGRQFTVTCKCGEQFEAVVEQRRHYRKPVALDGDYWDPLSEEKDSMVVEDLSLSGMNFVTVASHGVRSGDKVRVRFTLDTATQPVKERVVKVTSVEGRRIHGEFENPRRDADLGFYLMP